MALDKEEQFRQKLARATLNAETALEKIDRVRSKSGADEIFEIAMKPEMLKIQHAGGDTSEREIELRDITAKRVASYILNMEIPASQRANEAAYRKSKADLFGGEVLYHYDLFTTAEKAKTDQPLTAAEALRLFAAERAIVHEYI